MTRLADGMRWFKQTFGNAVNQGAAGTPFTLDFMTALATQETFEVWGNVFDRLPPARVLEICVGDVIDAPGRSAFPTSKAKLLQDPNGQALFKIARDALEDMGQFVAVYHRIAVANPNKFCHGFGIFQLDLQFAKSGQDPGYFLNKEWFDFGKCLTKALGELHGGLRTAGVAGKPVLTPLELAHVAIAYNTGSFNPAKGLKQGFRDQSGKFYGELIFGFIQLAQTI